MTGNNQARFRGGGGTLALCQGLFASKGPRATEMMAATDDGSIDQSNFHRLKAKLLSQLELN